MEYTVLILLAAAPLGAFDVVWFHLVTFRLYARPQSLYEEVTHILRGLLFPLGLGILLLGRPEGGWFWVVAGIFLIELVNSLTDITLEPQSRAPHGVPRVELVVHYLGATLMGAAGACFLVLEWDAAAQPTGLAPHGLEALSPWILPLGYVTVVAGALLIATEMVLFIRYRLARRREGAI